VISILLNQLNGHVDIDIIDNIAINIFNINILILHFFIEKFKIANL